MVLFFDRNAINFLMPYIQPEPELRYTEVGLLVAGLSFTNAIAGGSSCGWLSDKIARRKIIIVVSGLIFGLLGGFGPRLQLPDAVRRAAADGPVRRRGDADQPCDGGG